MDQSDGRKGHTGSTGLTSASCGIPNHFPAATVLVDRKGRIAYVSDLFATLASRPRARLIGRKLSRLLSTDTGAALPADLASGDPLIDAAMSLARPDSDPVDVLVSSERWVDPDGTIYAALVLRDQTATRTVQQDRDDLALRLQSVLDQTRSGTWSWRIDSGECQFSPRCADILGYTVEEIAPATIDTWRALIHPQDLEKAQASLDDHLKGRQPAFDVEVRMYHKTGREVWVRCFGQVSERAATGKPLRIIGTHMEIDQEKVSEDDHRRNHGMLNRMGRIAGVGGWEVDLRTGSILWSQETRRIHAVDDDFVPSLEDGINFYAPEARDTISSAVERGMSSGEPWDLELPFIRKNGSRIWVRAMGEVEFEDGAPVRLIGAFQDITQRIKHQNEMLAAQEWVALSAEKGRVGLWSLDIVMGKLNWDRQMAALFGIDLAARPATVAAWSDLLHEDMQEQLKQAIRRSLFSKTDMEVELTFDGPDGPRVVKLVGAPHADPDGIVDRLQGACFDLTEHRGLLSQLQAQATKLSVTLNSIGDGVITTDDAGRIAWMNPEAERLTGWDVDNAADRPVAEVLDLHDHASGEQIENPVLSAIRQRRQVGLPKDAMLRRPDGSSIAIDDSASPLFDQSGQIFGAVMVFRDTTEQRDQSREIEFRATHDPLTRLLNRTALIETLDQRIADPIKRLNSFLLAIDLDHFKRINDSFGHAAGDTVLCRIADILTECVGESDHVARLGGDEFCVLVRQPDLASATALGDRICTRIAEGAFLRRSSDIAIPTGASIGIMPLDQPDLTSGEAMKCADIAAYGAKNAGRGQVCVWSATDTDMTDRRRRGSLVQRIEEAVANGTWIVEAQPVRWQSDIDGEIAFHELLIRLPDEDGTAILPAEFLPAADRYGLLPSIDLWMLSHAFERLATATAGGVQSAVSVNVSDSSIDSLPFHRDALDIIAAAAPDLRTLLHLEVTETALLKDFDRTSQFLARVRALGPRVAIDAFGAGMSTFRHFRALPADYLKIDGSFTRNLGEPMEAASMAFITRMAKVADLKTVAAHVEDDAQIKLLEGLDVDLFQGFALGHPS